MYSEGYMSSSAQQTGSELEVGARLEASLADNFSGDTLLPGQFYDMVGRRRWQDGEYRLAFAVLADAVACYYKHKGSKSRRGRYLFEEVRLWMLSRNGSGVFAFRNLCEVLGIHPDALINALEKGREPAEPALREIRVWRGKPRRAMTAQTPVGRSIGSRSSSRAAS